MISLLVTACFTVTGLNFPLASAEDFRLPAPGVMVHLSPPFDLPMLKGIKVHADNPFRFDFILDQGDSELSKDQLKDESSKLIKYFLASLTIPEKDLWVNLSPYEKDRIIPNSFGLTEMGRDLLAEDYMLKQITASLIYPEDEVGKKFWKRIYAEAANKFGTTNIPVNTFNKVWIVPEKAVVYENAKAGTAYVVESRLKVMLEQDYLALSKNTLSPPGDMFNKEQQKNVSPSRLPSETGSNVKASQVNNGSTSESVSALGSQIIREVVIPELTKEINENKNFAKLRQVYNSLILATWYKKKIKDSILGQVYANKNKVAGVNIDNPNEKQKIYEQYLKAFKKGVYNYIKEDQEPLTKQPIPRKYFSGGVNLAMIGQETNLGLNRGFGVQYTDNFEAVPRQENPHLHFIVQSDMTSSAAMVSPERKFSLRNSFQSGRPMDIARGHYVYEGGTSKGKVSFHFDENAVRTFRSVFENLAAANSSAKSKLEWLRPLVIYAATRSQYYDQVERKIKYNYEIGQDGAYFKSVAEQVINIPKDGRLRIQLAAEITDHVLGFTDETITHILSTVAGHLEQRYLEFWGSQITDWEHVELILTANAKEVFQLSRTGEQQAVLRTELPAMGAGTRIGLPLETGWGVVEIRGPDGKVVKIDSQGRLQQPIKEGVYTYTIGPAITEFDTQGTSRGNIDAEFNVIDNDPLFGEFRDDVKKADGSFYDVQRAVENMVGKYMSYNADYNTRIGPVFTKMFARIVREKGYMNSQCNIGSLLAFILFKYAGFDVVYTEGWMMGPGGLVEGDVGHATVLVKTYGIWTGYDSTGRMGLFLNNPKAYEERREGKAREKAAKEDANRPTSQENNKKLPTGKKINWTLDKSLKNGSIIISDEKLKKELLKLFESTGSTHHVKEISRVATLSPGVHLYFFSDEAAPLVINENFPRGTTPEAWEKRAHMATKEEIDEANQAMNTRGGIDFTADKTPLEIQNSGGGIQFHLDSAQLAQLQNVPGFVPVIINIQPMINLKKFLGVPSEDSTGKLAPIHTIQPD